MPVDMKQSAAISTSKLVIVLARACRSLVDFLEGGLALQGIALTDFAILEALLHQGPLAGAAIREQALQMARVAVGRAMRRLIRRGPAQRLMRRDGSTTDKVE